jgi:hypothetical protein
MAEGSGARGAPPPFTDEELEHLGVRDPGVRAWMEARAGSDQASGDDQAPTARQPPG